MFTCEEIKEWSESQQQWFMGTIPPLVCAADIDSPIADGIPDEKCGSVQHYTAVVDYTFDDKERWGTLTGGGHYTLNGYPAISYLTYSRLNAITRSRKIVLLIGSDEAFWQLLCDDLGNDVVRKWVRGFRSDVGNDLNDEDFALELSDTIATQPIGAVVLLNQRGKLQHLDMVTAVPVFRGPKVAMTKKIPFFDVNTELVEWNEQAESLQFKATTFGNVVVEPVVEHDEDDRVGCVERATDIRKEHRIWLWPRYLGRNKVAHFGGASTEGKSPVTLDIAACVSSGNDWPDGARNTLGPRAVILLAAEDDWSDTIVPRLEVAGANLDNIYRFFVKQQTVEITPSLDSDCQRLEKQLEEIGNVALVVIDPITNYLGSKQMNHESEIRGGILMPLAALAKNNNCSVITVGHLNKRGSEVTVLQRLMGCAAFSGVARDVFIFGPDPDDEDKYAHTMTEIRNKSAPQLKYKTEMVKAEWDGKTSEVIKVKWCGVSHVDVDDVVNAPKQHERSITSRAVALITGMLRSGAKRKADIDQALKENGIPPEKLQFDRIRKRCKADTRPLPGKGAGWEWFLTTKQEQMFDEGR